MFNRSIVGLGILVALAGCAQPRSDRDTRLLTMAAQEANLVANLHERLMRQLNIADWQIHTGRRADGQITLAKAIETLHANDEQKTLDEFGRISGWASIAELARAAEDTPAALTACDEAVETLQAINPPERRCDYVLSLATQVETLRGQKAAAALLIKAGTWAEGITNVTERRRALVAFANRLFNQEQWDEGQNMMHHDKDAAWRSDTLAAMANMGTDQAGASFGKQVDYKSVYLNSEMQMNLRQQGVPQQQTAPKR